jgi:hypothetical protein
MQDQLIVPTRAEPATAISSPVHRELALSHETIISAAIQQHLPIAELQAAFDLAERMKASEAASVFLREMAAFQSEVGSIDKNSVANVKTKSGGTFSYRFGSLDYIADIIREPLSRHGFSYSWNQSTADRTMTVECIVCHVAGHSRTARFDCPIEGTDAQSGGQKAAGALTFGKRQSLIAALGLSLRGDDNDCPLPNAAPAADPSMPKVKPRKERATETPISAADLTALFTAWCKRADRHIADNPTKDQKIAGDNAKVRGDFMDWARGVMGSPANADLTLTGNWTRDGYDKCREAML